MAIARKPKKEKKKSLRIMCKPEIVATPMTTYELGFNAKVNFTINSHGTWT